jgi:hypothetical protein
VPQSGPAPFTVTITNTGDAVLVVTADDGVGTLTLAAGVSVTKAVTVDGPFAGQPTVSNVVTGLAKLDDRYGLSNVIGPKSASASCTVAGLAKVVKTVRGAPPTQPAGSGFTFQLRSGASTTDAGTILAALEANTGNGGVLTFPTNLVPDETYALCELVMPGWTTTLGPPSYVVYNPGDDQGFVCTDFTAAGGQTTTFAIDNRPPPGGAPRTIGFWKNWASCAGSNGRQLPILDQTLAKSEPAGITIGILTLHGSTTTPNRAPDCTAAVSVLNKSDIVTGRRMANDPLYNLAAQLLAAKLNVVAGAATCSAAVNAINNGQALLVKYQFNGTGTYTVTSGDATLARNLATTLDGYNNGTLC